MHFSFVGDVGGYMGLLLGGSVMSLFEFFDIVINYVFHRQDEKDKRNHDKAEKGDSKSLTISQSSPNEKYETRMWILSP